MDQDQVSEHEEETETPKVVLDLDEGWEKNLKDVKLRKEDMNRLVMNLLVTEGYREVAEKFQKESGTEPEVDLASITDRMSVKKAIQCGNIDNATETLKALYPELLEEMNFDLRQQKLIELIRKGETEEALKFSQDELAPFAVNNEAFQEELEKTVALLCFEDLSTCPVKELLDYWRRMKIASKVNEAILTSQIGEKGHKLETLLKILTWTQNKIDEEAVYPRILDLSSAQILYAPGIRPE